MFLLKQNFYTVLNTFQNRSLVNTKASPILSSFFTGFQFTWNQDWPILNRTFRRMKISFIWLYRVIKLNVIFDFLSRSGTNFGSLLYSLTCDDINFLNKHLKKYVGWSIIEKFNTRTVYYGKYSHNNLSSWHSSLFLTSKKLLAFLIAVITTRSPIRGGLWNCEIRISTKTDKK